MSESLFSFEPVQLPANAVALRDEVRLFFAEHINGPRWPLKPHADDRK